MGRRTIRGILRKSLSLACLALAVSWFHPVFPPDAAAAADLTLSSKTYGLYSEKEVAGGQTERYAPLYEYLSADATNLGGKPVAIHFYGWGRADLADASGSGKTSGDIGSLYLEYLHPQGNAQVKAGRFLLAEGVAMETLDGGFARMTMPFGLGISAYGGGPVEHSILDNTKKGDSLFGGRVFFARPGFVEIGASYLKENGSFQGKNRELYGGDLWLRVAGQVELTGQVAYNQAEREIASQRYAVRIVSGPTFDISAGYESYTYKGLFQPSLNPAFVPPSVDNADKVQTIFGVLDWGFLPGWTLELAAKDIRHDKSDPGNADRGEIGVRYAYNGRKDVAGLSAAFVAADRDENEYQEYRGFASYSPAKLRLALDALAQQYKKEPVPGVGKKNAYQVVASAGYQLLASLLLSGDLTYTQSPNYQKDYAGLIRATLELGTSTGGKK